MRKFLAIAIVIALLLTSSVAFASVGYKKDGDNSGNATYIDFKNGYTTFDGSTVSFYANGYRDGVTTNVSGESNLSSAAVAYGIILIADTGALDGSNARYISLADGEAGQMITIQLVAATAGTLYITDDKIIDANMTMTGWDDIALNAALDQVTLLWVDDTYGWIIVGQYGITVT
jgi:hypothetical protein